MKHKCVIKDELWYYLAKEKIRRDKTIKDKQEIKPHKSWNDLFELFNSKKTNNYKDKISATSFDFNCTDFKEENDKRFEASKMDRA